MREDITALSIRESSNSGKTTVFALYGSILIVIGVALYMIAAAAGAIRALLFYEFIPRGPIESMLWYSATPIVFGAILFLCDLRTVGKKRAHRQLRENFSGNHKFTVALTAYNDEASIGTAVRDFLSRPDVVRVIVVSNNSVDRTESFAIEAGAIVVNEREQGYGACVRRALSEASAFDDTEFIALCEGDCTFRAYDLDKMMSYLSHADVVNGTRIVDTLQEGITQITLFMHYGNLAVAKLLELKYFGDATLTDVGTTYKVMRREVASHLSKELDLQVNLEFNPYLLERTIAMGLRLVEVPITFHPRIGVSKGGNVSNKVAVRVGVRMIRGILFGWRTIVE